MSSEMCPGALTTQGAEESTLARRLSHALLLLGAVVLLFASVAVADDDDDDNGGGTPPPNDLCADAIVISEGQFNFSTHNAGTDGMNGSACSTFGSEQTWNDIWYRYSATADGILVFSTCNTVDYDSRIIAYTGDCESLVEVACNDDGPGCDGYSSFLLFECEAGVEYFIRIGGYAPNQTGSGTFGVKYDVACDLSCPQDAQIELEECGQTLNDGCISTGALASAMTELVTPGVPLCGTWFFDGSFRDTDWYALEVPAPGGFVSAQLFSNDRVTGYVYLAQLSCPANVLVYSFGGCPTQLESNLLPPGIYGIIVAPGYDTVIDCEDSSGMSEYRLTVDVHSGGLSVPENDACDNAFIVGDGGHSFTTELADTDGPTDAPASCSNYGTLIGSDVWYRYTASCTGVVSISTCNTADYDTRLQVWKGACGEGELLACNDDGEECAGFTSEVEFAGVCGDEYLIRVAGYGMSWGTGTLNIACEGSCDCNVNGIPDEDDIAGGTSEDCDGNGVPDECTLAEGLSDCNENGVIDACDLASGSFSDKSGDGILDVCQCELHPEACCFADIDGNGSVGGEDLAFLLGAWGDPGGESDLDGDGTVTGSDLALLLGAWGDC